MPFIRLRRSRNAHFALLGALGILVVLGLSLSNTVAGRQADVAAVVGAVPGQQADATPPAPTSSAFILRPSDGTDGDYFDITGEPGSTHELTAVLANAGSEPIALRTFVADAFTLVNGGFGVREESDEKTGATAWIDYPAETIELDPQESVERTFTVSIPADAAPGQYIAGIVLQTDQPQAIEGSESFQQIIRKVAAVFITVPGEERVSLTIGEPSFEFTPSVIILNVPITNDGNVLVKPEGSLTLRDAAGTVILDAPLQLQVVYAGHETSIQIPLTGQLAPGSYTLDIELRDEAKGLNVSEQALPMELSEAAQQAQTLSIQRAEITPEPATGTPQYANVSVDITNAGATVPGSRLTLVVSHNGQELERFVLAPMLAIPANSTTTVEQRYIPPGGWEPGSYDFALILEMLDPNTGIATLVEQTDVVATIEVAG